VRSALVLQRIDLAVAKCALSVSASDFKLSSSLLIPPSVGDCPPLREVTLLAWRRDGVGPQLF
jgi:hypothetical protein